MNARRTACVGEGLQTLPPFGRAICRDPERAPTKVFVAAPLAAPFSPAPAETTKIISNFGEPQVE